MLHLLYPSSSSTSRMDSISGSSTSDRHHLFSLYAIGSVAVFLPQHAYRCYSPSPSPISKSLCSPLPLYSLLFFFSLSRSNGTCLVARLGRQASRPSIIVCICLPKPELVSLSELFKSCRITELPTPELFINIRCSDAHDHFHS